MIKNAFFENFQAEIILLSKYHKMRHACDDFPDFHDFETSQLFIKLSSFLHASSSPFSFCRSWTKYEKSILCDELSIIEYEAYNLLIVW